MATHDQPLAGPRALTFGFIGGLVSWALVAAMAFVATRLAH